MRKSFSTCLLAIFLCGCNSETIYDVPVEIILDHPIGDARIKNNKEVYDFLLPFPESTGDDSIILNFIPRFKRIDIDPAYVDSLKIDSTWLVKAQVWLGGGRDNPALFIRNRISEITDATISNNFLSPLGDQSNVDSFLFKNPGRYIILSRDTALVSSYRASFGNNTILAFESSKNLKEFLRSKIIDSLSKLVQPIRIIFSPRYRYVSRYDTITVRRVLDSFSVASTVTKINNPSPTPQKSPVPDGGRSQAKASSGNDNPCDSSTTLISRCISMPSGEAKLIFFYSEVFRFVKGNPCSSARYEELLMQILSLIEGRPPRFVQGGVNVHYDLACSHLRDLTREFQSFEIAYNKGVIDEILGKCPN
jgi:hypothetical protein